MTCGRACPKIAAAMFYLREVIAVLCLVLLAWTLFAPIGAPDILSVLPVIAILPIAVVPYIETSRMRVARYQVLPEGSFTAALRSPYGLSSGSWVETAQIGRASCRERV